MNRMSKYSDIMLNDKVTLVRLTATDYLIIRHKPTGTEVSAWSSAMGSISG